MKITTAFSCILIVLGASHSLGQKSAVTRATRPAVACEYWQSKVDVSVRAQNYIAAESERDSAVVLNGIECLLKLKGEHSSSTFASATVGYDISQRFPPPTVEVAALYYASYLYYHNWQHARAIVLMDSKGRKNTKHSVRTAYAAYEAWFAKVKGIGLQQAREQDLDPLAGTNVRWY